MSQDELTEINGIKPKVLLLDGEEKEVNSMSRFQTSVLHVLNTNLQPYSHQQFRVQSKADI